MMVLALWLKCHELCPPGMLMLSLSPLTSAMGLPCTGAMPPPVMFTFVRRLTGSSLTETPEPVKLTALRWGSAWPVEKTLEIRESSESSHATVRLPSGFAASRGSRSHCPRHHPPHRCREFLNLYSHRTLPRRRPRLCPR